MEEMEKEKKSGWTGILLILNLIIWTIVLFIAFIFNGIVHAQTINMTNLAWADNNDNWTFVNTGTTFGGVGVKKISFNFNDTPDNNNGTINFETDITGSISMEEIRTYWYTNPNPSTTGTVSKACRITQVNLLTNHLTCVINFTITNNSQNLNVILEFANAKVLQNASATGMTDWQQSNNATTSDIVNQTIQITNQIMESVQNAINNTTDVSGNIIYQMQQAIIDATRTIIGKDMFCDIINASDIKTQNKGLDGEGNEFNYTSYGITGYIKIDNTTITQTQTQAGSNSYMCFYDKNKTKIGCISTLNHGNGEYTKPNGAYYMRATISKNQNVPVFEICKDRLEWILENQNSNTDRIIDRLYQDHQEQLIQLAADWTNIPVNRTELTNLESIENDLHTITDVDLDVMTINLDPDTGGWVWNTITSILNANSMVFGMIISILSIGIIKLILNR